MLPPSPRNLSVTRANCVLRNITESSKYASSTAAPACELRKHLRPTLPRAAATCAGNLPKMLEKYGSRCTCERLQHTAVPLSAWGNGLNINRRQGRACLGTRAEKANSLQARNAVQHNETVAARNANIDLSRRRRFCRPGTPRTVPANVSLRLTWSLRCWLGAFVPRTGSATAVVGQRTSPRVSCTNRQVAHVHVCGHSAPCLHSLTPLATLLCFIKGQHGKEPTVRT